MSSAEIPYKVFYYPSATGAVDITPYVVSVTTNRQGTGKIRTATLMLVASEGKFISDSSGGATPIVSHFDDFKIVWTDENGLVQSMIVSVDQILKQLTVQGRHLLPLELKGRERALQDIMLPAYYKWKDPLTVIKDIIRRYNNYSKGTQQPAVLFDIGGTTLDIPSTVVNVYDFSSGTTYYDAIMHVITRLGQSTDLGGVGDFFTLEFDDYEGLGQKDLLIKIRVQGKTNGPIPTLKSTEADPIHSITTTYKAQSATQVLVAGTPNTGFHPNDLHRYISYVELINNIPAYKSTATYITGIRVNHLGLLYKAKTFVPLATPPPNPTYWDPITPSDIIGPMNYSLWTKNKATVIKNSCSNPDNPFLTGGFNAPAFPDGNLVIRDRVVPSTGEYRFFRDFAWMRAKNPDDIVADPRKKQYLMGVSNDQFYNGFTVLVDTSLGAVGGAFVGNDRFNRPFANSIVMYTGTEWIVIRQPQTGDQCCVLMEGRTYEWNRTPTAANIRGYGNGHNFGFGPKLRNSVGGFAWRDVSGTAGGNDAFHRPKDITNVKGLIADKINGLDYSSYVANSAVKVVYEYSAAQAVFDSLHTLLDKVYQGFVKFGEGLLAGKINLEFDFTTAEIDRTLESEFYNYGWWFAFPFPYPFSTFNGITEDVGELYGRGDTVDFAALDIMNANFTHGGLTGFNNDDASDLGGPFTGIRFWFVFDILIEGIRRPFQGNVPFTITVYDDLRNVWRADFTVRLLGDPQEIQIPWGQFTVNRPSRTPFQIDSLADIIENILVPELEIRSIFEQRRVRLITIQYAGAYDEHLRYSPVNLDRLLATFGSFFAVRFEGIIDGFGLTKQPFVTSGVETSRVLNPPIFQAPNVRNFLQLESIAKAQKDLFGLKFEQYVVEVNGNCKYELEQSIYLEDQDLINEMDKPATPNTRKLILMQDSLSFDQFRGFIKTLTLTKRLGGP